MEFNHPIEIDLLDFFRTGRFDYIKLGQSKEFILNNFPFPDDFGMGKNLKSATIWRYGNFEFHFSNDGLLEMIFCDDVLNIYGGKSLTIIPWIFGQQSSLQILAMIRHLLEEHIDFSVSGRNEECKIHIPDSGVSMKFSSINTDNQQNDVIPLDNLVLEAFWKE